MPKLPPYVDLIWGELQRNLSEVYVISVYGILMEWYWWGIVHFNRTLDMPFHILAICIIISQYVARASCQDVTIGFRTIFPVFS